MTGQAKPVEPADAANDLSMVGAVRLLATVSPLPGVAKFLLNILPAQLVAYACGCSSTRHIKTIGHGKNVDVSHEIEARLRCTYEVVLLLLHFDAPETVQAWFIGMSPELDDTAPVEAVRDGRFKDAMGAARAFIAYG